MRTAVANAASPRRLLWQAALSTEAYRASSPVVWQHIFVSAPMTNWSGGSSRFLNWAAQSLLENEGGSRAEPSDRVDHVASGLSETGIEICSLSRDCLCALVRP
jgi:hypothetical protein